MQSWNIPPCISNWKNARGYTIPVGKRLAEDDSQDPLLNDRFSKLSEALYIAERYARDEVARHDRDRSPTIIEQSETIDRLTLVEDNSEICLMEMEMEMEMQQCDIPRSQSRSGRLSLSGLTDTDTGPYSSPANSLEQSLADSPPIADPFISFDDVSVDKISLVQKEVEQVKKMMEESIDSLLVRGEKLEALEKKTEQLQDQSYHFRRRVSKDASTCPPASPAGSPSPPPPLSPRNNFQTKPKELRSIGDTSNSSADASSLFALQSNTFTGARPLPLSSAFGGSTWSLFGSSTALPPAPPGGEAGAQPTFSFGGASAASPRFGASASSSFSSSALPPPSFAPPGSGAVSPSLGPDGGSGGFGAQPTFSFGGASAPPPPVSQGFGASASFFGSSAAPPPPPLAGGFGATPPPSGAGPLPSSFSLKSSAAAAPPAPNFSFKMHSPDVAPRLFSSSTMPIAPSAQKKGSLPLAQHRLLRKARLPVSKADQRKEKEREDLSGMLVSSLSKRLSVMVSEDKEDDLCENDGDDDDWDEEVMVYKHKPQFTEKDESKQNALLALTNAAHFWELTEALADIIGVTLEAIESKILMLGAKSLGIEVYSLIRQMFATALALAYFAITNFSHPKILQARQWLTLQETLHVSVMNTLQLRSNGMMQLAHTFLSEV